MKTKLHAIAGTIGFLTIATFWTTTLVSELFGDQASITSVKNFILWGMLVLIPAMAVTAGSGFSLSAGRRGRLVDTKKKRMPIIGANGLLILIPCAFFLAAKANAGEFDTTFYAVQGLELIAGAANLTLMGLNIRDGLKMTGRLRQRSA